MGFHSWKVKVLIFLFYYLLGFFSFLMTVIEKVRSDETCSKGLWVGLEPWLLQQGLCFNGMCSTQRGTGASEVKVFLPAC